MSKIEPVGLLCHWHLALRHAIEVLALHSENSKVQAKAAASCLELCFLHRKFWEILAQHQQFLIWLDRLDRHLVVPFCKVRGPGPSWPLRQLSIAFSSRITDCALNFLILIYSSWAPDTSDDSYGSMCRRCVDNASLQNMIRVFGLQCRPTLQNTSIQMHSHS